MVVYFINSLGFGDAEVGLCRLLNGLDKWYETFVKSRYIDWIVRLNDRQIRISFLETMSLSVVPVIVPVVSGGVT